MAVLLVARGLAALILAQASALALAAQDPTTAKSAPTTTLAAPVDPVPVLDGATFVRHWQHVVPSADEMAWRVIPWLGTLAEAVVQAHAQDMPILLWAMNGHPLACT
jgi:hypothetical protein